MTNKLYNSGASWGTIIFLLILFFPVGIYMMVNKLHIDTQNITVNARRTRIVGWVFVGVGVLYLLMALTGSLQMSNGGSPIGAGFMMLIICGASGYALVHHADKYKKIGTNYDKYIAVLENSIDGRLYSIANAMNRPQKEVTEDLQQLIAMRLIQDTYINTDQGMVVGPIVGRKVTVANAARQQARTQTKTVKCPSCGAINRIDAGHRCCEYCGNPLV